MDIEILYKDRDMLICKKPAGVPSQPDPTGQDDLLSALSKNYPTVKLIHRLDTPTGGVMVFGLSQKATAKLGTMVQDHEIFCKEYLAVLSSSPENEEGTLRDYIYHDKRVNKAFIADSARKGCKEAVLDYRVIAKAEEGHTLVLVRLHTGRTHQIRVQFASRGLPLVGDGKYGSREKCPFIGLWAYRLTFPHPIKGTTVSLSADPDKNIVPWSIFGNDIN
jgi:23S rRNA pseudouridine1911/1915/1917 synthase